MSNLNYAYRHSNISTLPQISNQIFKSKFILSNLNYASRHSNMPTWHQICTQKSKTITHTSVGFRNFKLHNWIISTTGRLCRWHTILKLPLPVVFYLGFSSDKPVISPLCILWWSLTNVWHFLNTQYDQHWSPYNKWEVYNAKMTPIFVSYLYAWQQIQSHTCHNNKPTTSIVDSCSKLGCSHWESDWIQDAAPVELWFSVSRRKTAEEGLFGGRLRKT